MRSSCICVEIERWWCGKRWLNSSVVTSWRTVAERVQSKSTGVASGVHASIDTTEVHWL